MLKKEKTNPYSLNNGFSPFCMPVVTPPESRDQIQQALCDAGVVCYIGWPEAPFGKKGFKGADTLKVGLLEMPVHKFMDSHHLNIIVDCLNSQPKYVKRSQVWHRWGNVTSFSRTVVSNKT